MNTMTLVVSHIMTLLSSQGLLVAGPKLWNSLPSLVKQHMLFIAFETKHSLLQKESDCLLPKGIQQLLQSKIRHLLQLTFCAT